jgi:hypothetical protein
MESAKSDLCKGLGNYQERRVVRYYEEPRPVRTRRVVRSYDYGYAPVSSRTVTYSYGSPYYGSGYYRGW